MVCGKKRATVDVYQNNAAHTPVAKWPLVAVTAEGPGCAVATNAFGEKGWDGRGS